VIKFFAGLLLTIIGVFILIILTFAYRDFGISLFLMFLFALVLYPYGIYLMIRNKPSFKEECKVGDDKEDMKKMREMYESD